KMGFCLRKLGRVQEALKLYLRILKSDPDDLNTVLVTAHCYLDTGNYDKALKHYFRIEYENPGNVRVLRPIAWCFLVTGRFTEAAGYFERITESSLTPHDRVNMGHLALCQGNPQKAIELYLSAVAEGGITAEAFVSVFSEDSAVLIKNGVSPDDLPIVLDYVLMSLEDRGQG
ncbi:MAG: tetratricopeptide repeat protein, partial [Bacteroidales bacterium]|nr:tetratricopeptide repeat protein [Bacteroidales bacterium]